MAAPLPRQSKSGQAVSMDIEPSVLAEPDSEEADSLVSSNDPDDMANEQTWPTEEEMAGAMNEPGDQDDIPGAPEATAPKATKRVPKGTSAYQAAWIIDESDGEDDDLGEGSDVHDGIEMDDAEEEEMVELPIKGEDEEDADLEADGRRSVAFQDLDMDEENRQ